MRCIAQVTKQIRLTGVITARTRSIANCDAKLTSPVLRRFLMAPNSTISVTVGRGFLRPGRLAEEALSQKRVSLRKRCGKVVDFWGLMNGAKQLCRFYHPGYHTAGRSHLRGDVR